MGGIVRRRKKMMKDVLYVERRGRWKKTTRMGQLVSLLAEGRKMSEGCLDLK